MAKSWKPKVPKAFQPLKPFKPFKFEDPFKPMKEPKKEPIPHIMTPYERDLINLLHPAIMNKQIIDFWYEDETTDFVGHRRIEPHLIGQTKFKAANIWLVGWFLPNHEQAMDGHEAKWGNYILDKISKVEILHATYVTSRALYNESDKRMTKIYSATRK